MLYAMLQRSCVETLDCLRTPVKRSKVHSSSRQLILNNRPLEAVYRQYHCTLNPLVSAGYRNTHSDLWQWTAKSAEPTRIGGDPQSRL